MVGFDDGREDQNPLSTRRARKCVVLEAGFHPHQLRRLFFAWLGLRDEPADSTVSGFDDLVAMVLDRMKEPVNVVAHSIGGPIAIKVAPGAPEKVKRLPLVGISAGIPVADQGGSTGARTSIWLSHVRRGGLRNP